MTGWGRSCWRGSPRAGWPDVTTIEDFQLQIEHALDLDGAEAALFLDAGRDTPAPFAFAEIAPRRGGTHTTHAIAPEAVLDVYARTLGKTPPPSFTLCVRGERFELGEGLSAEAAERLEAAWAFLQGLMRERTVEAWRRAARPEAEGRSRRAKPRRPPRAKLGARGRFQRLRRQKLQLCKFCNFQGGSHCVPVRATGFAASCRGRQERTARP